jgi:hypothetical protein
VRGAGSVTTVTMIAIIVGQKEWGSEPMAVAEPVTQPAEQQVDKGLKAGALGLVSTTIIATASVAPAYSIAATLVFVVGAVALQSPAVAVLAFVPMLLTSIGYSELNKADPDCGTTFTWATRAFNPRTGWAGGWGIIAADVLVMASLAQVAGQYGFLLFNAKGIGENPGSSWVLLVGVLWIVVMTYICYRGIEVSANFQKALLAIELVMLAVLSVTALVKVGNGTAPPGHLTPSISWLNPFHISSFSAFASGIILMVFIYWGWDTAVAVNEETKDKNKTPGRAAILSTFILLSSTASSGIRPSSRGRRSPGRPRPWCPIRTPDWGEGGNRGGTSGPAGLVPAGPRPSCPGEPAPCRVGNSRPAGRAPASCRAGIGLLPAGLAPAGETARAAASGRRPHRLLLARDRHRQRCPP